MINMKYKRISADSCVYIRSNASGVVVIAVYVDDLIIARNSIRLVESVKQEFHKRYKIKDMGVLEYVLGVRVDQIPEQKLVQLSQRSYILICWPSLK